MFKAIQTSVSGLIASTARLNVAASNITNAHVKSTPGTQGVGRTGETFQGYAPQRVEQITTKSGGVQAKSVPVSPASLSVYDPSSPLASEQGVVNIPNVSFPVEMSELIKAKHAYKANASVLKTLDDTFKTITRI